MVRNILMALALIVLMVISTGALVGEFSQLSSKIKSKRLLLSALIVGLASLLPELFFGVSAAFFHQPQMALGSLMGANLINLSFVVGGAALVAGTIPVVGEFQRRELWITVSLALMPIILMADGNLSRLDGVWLIFGYLLYANNLVKHGRFEIRQAKIDNHKIHEKLSVGVGEKFGILLKLLFFFGVLIASSIGLVSIVRDLAIGLEVSDYWIGLTFVAIGITLPGLLVAIEDLIRNRVSLVLTNILGGVCTSSTLLIGVIALISPVSFGDSSQKILAGLSLVLVLGMFWLFSKTQKRLSRAEGLTMMGVYLFFLGLQLLLANSF